MASVVAVHTCVKASTCVLLHTKDKSALVWRSLFKGDCRGVSGVGETLITCNEIPEMTLQKGNSKHPTPTASQYIHTLIRSRSKKKKKSDGLMTQTCLNVKMHLDFEIKVTTEIAVVDNDSPDLIIACKWDRINNIFLWFMLLAKF